MKVKRIILVLLFAPALLFAQNSELDDYQSEFVWGINKNTAGGLIGGFAFRKSRKISEGMFQSLGLEVVNLKHNQETQLRSGTGSTYIYGKTNYLYALRFQYGRELILFRKAPQQGVEIKAVAAIGPTLGLHAPYYVEISPDLGASLNNTKREQYNPNDPDHNIGNILGTGYLFQGIYESNLKLGANLKAGLSFELGTIKSNVTGFEVGTLIDAYTEEIKLLAGADNKSVYPTAYITIFYGTRR
jgi:hypothetical protein